MSDLIVKRLFKKNWLGVTVGINPEVKELFQKKLIIRWQQINENRILMEVNRND